MGAALRALHKFLKEADLVGQKAGPGQTSMLGCNLLWLCPEHHQLHVAKPLVLGTPTVDAG